MNEKQLKELFCRSLKNGHIEKNNIFPSSNPDTEFRVIDEANFRCFDLVIAAINRQRDLHPAADIYYSLASNENILARTGLLSKLAIKEKCQIESINFYPVELKSDDDVIDNRLARQIINAIITFGVSIVVLDENHSRRIKSRGIHKLLPATIIGYKGQDDHFEVLSFFDEFVTDTVLDIHKRSLARLLLENNIEVGSDKVHRRIVLLQGLLQKIIFNQMYGTVALSREEKEFIQSLGNLPVFSNRKLLTKIMKETGNTKITDYVVHRDDFPTLNDAEQI